MSKTTKKNLSLQMAAIFTIAVLTIGTTQFALAKDDSRVKIEGEFAGIDDGTAKFESRDDGDRKKFSVEIIGIDAGIFTIEVKNTGSVTVLSTITTSVLGAIDFNLDTQCEDDGSDCSPIPDMESGYTVIVSGLDLNTVAILD